MKPDRHAVIWTRSSDGPVKMGSLVVTERENRFSYNPDFLQHEELAGLSLLAPPKIFGTDPVVYHNRSLLTLYPRLMSLIPGHQPHNVQRKIYAQILQKRTQPPRTDQDVDWEMLLLAGHNGIGHIDVFGTDLIAQAFYGQPTEGQMVTTRSAFWSYVKRDILEATDLLPPETLLRLLGPTPSVGGMIPKILAAIPAQGHWDGRFAPPGTRQQEGVPYRDVVLKFEQPIYEGVLALEALCLDVHRELGFEVPNHRLAEFDGVRMLAVERFDRTTEGLPLPVESFFSVLAAGDREVQTMTDIDMSSVGKMIEKLATLVTLDARQIQREVYQRFCVALVTGNGDLHLENLSFAGGPQQVRLAPVYDPAPMRAWPQHNLLSAIPIVIDPDLGGMRENIIAMGRAFGLTPTAAADLLQQAAEKTTDYEERVATLKQVPEPRRNVLRKIVSETRRKLGLDRLQSAG